jgi:hypothetical protein
MRSLPRELEIDSASISFSPIALYRVGCSLGIPHRLMRFRRRPERFRCLAGRIEPAAIRARAEVAASACRPRLPPNLYEA